MANLIKPRYLLKLLHFNADRDRCNRTVDGKQNDVPSNVFINPLNAEINPIYHLLALLGARHILHVSRISVKFHKFSYKLRPIQRAEMTAIKQRVRTIV